MYVPFLGEGLFSFLTNANDSECIYHTVQRRFKEIKRRDQDFQKGMVQKTSQKAPNPKIPPREYSDNPSSQKKATAPKLKPRPSAKPKNIKMPTAEYLNVGAENTRTMEKNAAVNDIILKNKQTIRDTAGDDGTYGESPMRKEAAVYCETGFTPLNPTAKPGNDDDHTYYDVVGM